MDTPLGDGGTLFLLFFLGKLNREVRVPRTDLGEDLGVTFVGLGSGGGVSEARFDCLSVSPTSAESSSAFAGFDSTGVIFTDDSIEALGVLMGESRIDVLATGLSVGRILDGLSIDVPDDLGARVELLCASSSSITR